MMVQTKEFPDEVRFRTIFEANVPIKKMFVDGVENGGYARPLNQRRLNWLVRRYRPQSVGVLLLSLRDNGTYAIIDGHHRAQASVVHGVEALDAYVYLDLTREEEAALYAEFGDYLKQTARDRFAAGLVAQDENILALNALVERAGLRVLIGGGQTRGGIQAVNALVSVARDYDPDHLTRTLTFLKAAFGDDERAYTSNIIKGTAAFLIRYHNHPKLQLTKLIQRLRGGGREELTARALGVARAERTSGTPAIGKALLYIHNDGLSVNRLPVWQDRWLSETVKDKNTRILRTRAEPARKALEEKTGKRVGGASHGKPLKPKPIRRKAS